MWFRMACVAGALTRAGLPPVSATVVAGGALFSNAGSTRSGIRVTRRPVLAVQTLRGNACPRNCHPARSPAQSPSLLLTVRRCITIVSPQQVTFGMISSGLRLSFSHNVFPATGCSRDFCDKYSVFDTTNALQSAPTGTGCPNPQDFVFLARDFSPAAPSSAWPRLGQLTTVTCSARSGAFYRSG